VNISTIGANITWGALIPKSKSEKCHPCCIEKPFSLFEFVMSTIGTIKFFILNDDGGTQRSIQYFSYLLCLFLNVIEKVIMVAIIKIILSIDI